MIKNGVLCREWTREDGTKIRVKRPFKLLLTDISGPFPEMSGGNKYILLLTDHFTKWVEVYAITNKEARTVADKLVDVINWYRVPEKNPIRSGQKL